MPGAAEAEPLSDIHCHYTVEFIEINFRKSLRQGLSVIVPPKIFALRLSTLIFQKHVGRQWTFVSLLEPTEAQALVIYDYRSDC